MQTVRCALTALLALMGCSTAPVPPLADARPAPSSTPTPALLFRPLDASSGLDFEHHVFAGGAKALPETMGAGGALLNYDRDGHLDIYLLQGIPLTEDPANGAPSSRLYRGHGDGTFSDVTVATQAGVVTYGMGVATGDVDGDGYVDLYITGYGGNHLLMNRAGTHFEDVTESAGLGTQGWSTSAAFLDIDTDGDLDLYVVRYVNWSAANNPACSPREGIRVYCHPDDFEGQTDLLYRNLGGARFIEVGAEAGTAVAGGEWESKGLGVVVADLDSDGHADLYVANDSTRNFQLQGDGKGRFTDVSLRSGTGFNGLGQTEASMGVDAADIDGDGDLDLFITNLDYETNTLYLNLGHGLFRDATAELGLAADSVLLVGFGAAFLDADRDGDPDLFVANGHVIDNVALYRPESSHAQPFLLYENDGTGHYRNVAGSAGEVFQRRFVARGVATGDLDDDGDADILVTVNGGAPVILRNDSPARGHWLGVRLRGRSSNRDGIGAMVRLYAGDRTQLCYVSSAGGYLTARDPRLLYGLGKASSVSRLEVAWPSGVKDTIAEPPLDRYLLIEEGLGLVENDR